MTVIQHPDLDDTLVRTADHLMCRAAEYHEMSLRQMHSARPRHRQPRSAGHRIAVGSAAAAALVGVALVGSFIGGSPTGQSRVAEAAWSAVPSVATTTDVELIARDCSTIVRDIFAPTATPPQGAPNVSVPGWSLEPMLVDVRGTTTSALYHLQTRAAVCMRFGDGSVNVGSFDMPELPVGTGSGTGSVSPIPIDVAGETVLLLAGFVPNASQNPDTVSPWLVSIEQEGEEPIEATVAGDGRFMAWTPHRVPVTVRFVDTSTGAETRLTSIDLDAASVIELPGPQTTIVVSNP